jgi:hypothetical protein
VTIDGGEVWLAGNVWNPADDTSTGVIFRRTRGSWGRVKVSGLPPAAHGEWFSAIALRDGDVWVVGSYDNNHVVGDTPVDDDGWLAARRHGGRWHVSKGGFMNGLGAISVRSGSDAWAVGGSLYGPIASLEELIVHWNGAAWVELGGQPDVVTLGDVLALARDDVWAVGTTRTEGVPYPDANRPVVEHWDGRRWTRLALPGTPWPGTPSLGALAAFAPDDIWAGGGVKGRPALLHWNGERWRKATPPPVAGTISGLAAGRNGALWALGPHFVAHSSCR